MVETSLVANTSPNIGKPLTPAESLVGGLAAPAQVKAFLGAFPDYAPTPLVPLKALAAELGVGGIDRLCCTNPFWDSSHESSVVAGIHEQTHTSNLQDQELAILQ